MAICLRPGFSVVVQVIFFRMGGMLGVGVGLLVVGLIGLVVFPWGGAVVAVVGLALIVAFVAGLVRRAPHPRP